MRPVLRVMAVTGLIFVGAQALGADPAGHSRNSKRQIADCILKRMSASRTLSFNDATKACKEQMKPQEGDLASNAPVKPVDGR
jgi:hypothetical protein